MNNKPTDAEILEWVRELLRNGATIRATEPFGKILERTEDGTCHGGLTIEGLPTETFDGVPGPKTPSVDDMHEIHKAVKAALALLQPHICIMYRETDPAPTTDKWRDWDAANNRN